MVSVNQIGPTQRLRPAPVNKPRLLLVSDSIERLTRLRTLLESTEIEITDLLAIDELNQACRAQHCLAVIDVGPERLVEVLEALRRSAEHAAIPLLVEAGRISNDPGPAVNLAGVLPSYRAMPCHQSEIVALTRNLFAGETVARNVRGIL